MGPSGGSVGVCEDTGREHPGLEQFKPEVLALLRRFNGERGQTTVIVTHDPRIAAATDRTIHMGDGLIADDPRLALVA